MRNANLVTSYFKKHDNFATIETNQLQHKIFPDFPQQIGFKNLLFAGDYLKTEYPTFLMETATVTGIDAANKILLEEKLQQEPYEALTKFGPGLFGFFQETIEALRILRNR